MSYDFLMMKPKVEISSPDDLGEDTLLCQNPSVLVEALSALFPQLAWQKRDDGGWFGSLDGDDTWYEFRIDAEPDYVWSVHTSHRTNTRKLIPVICDALGVIAFDGQALRLIQPGRGDTT
jgi:hypothetical protein